MTTTTDHDTVIKNDEKIDKPKMYKVLLHNDDFTPFDLVVAVLTTFGHDVQTAFDLMMAAHLTGIVVCGVYSKDVAETKAAVAMDLAKKHESALMLTVEKDD